jgi:hypothetical protein
MEKNILIITGINMQRYARLLRISLSVMSAIIPIKVREIIRDSKNSVKSCTKELKIFGVFIL